MKELPEPIFKYRRFVNFWETDAMGVVHHSNFPKMFEEVRMAWMRHHRLTPEHYPGTDIILAVLEYGVQHHRPLKFGGEVDIYMQMRRVGAKIEFWYAVREAHGPWVATGRTLQAPLNSELKPRKLPPPLRQQLEKEPWIETWPSNS